MAEDPSPKFGKLVRSALSEMADQELIRVDKVSRAFSGVKALDAVSLTIAPGEIHGLVGENGSGKSTLIKVMAGVLSPDAGRLRIRGEEFDRLRPIAAIREGIQVIYQDFSLFPNLTVVENIALNTELAEDKLFVSQDRMREVAGKALGRLGVSLDLSAGVEDISVSERQLVAIARALVQDARLIIMDEPTTSLTLKEVESLLDVIRKLKRSAVAVLLVSHKLNEVCEVAERITVLRNGRVTAEVREKPFDPLALAQQMTGRHLEPRVRAHRRRDSGVSLLRVEGLSKEASYTEVTFSLHRQEILGITGLLGSGQTELALGLFGLVPPEAGRMLVSGRRVEITSVQSALELGIAYVPSDRLTEGLFLQHSIARNLGVSLVRRFSSWLGFVDLRRWGEEVRLWIKEMAVSVPSVELPVNVLSGGNQQRVVIGRWLATQPQILILNNPTAGVDVGSKYQIHRLLRKLSDDGMGILLISDDLPELLENCDRVLLMGKGRIIEECVPSDVNEEGLSRKIVAGVPE